MHAKLPFQIADSESRKRSGKEKEEQKKVTFHFGWLRKMRLSNHCRRAHTIINHFTRFRLVGCVRRLSNISVQNLMAL